MEISSRFLLETEQELENFREEVKNHPRTIAFKQLKEIQKEKEGTVIKFYKTEFSPWVNYCLENKKGEPLFFFVSEGNDFVLKWSEVYQ
jgi:hypothetical protein